MELPPRSREVVRCLIEVGNAFFGADVGRRDVVGLVFGDVAVVARAARLSVWLPRIGVGGHGPVFATSSCKVVLKYLPDELDRLGSMLATRPVE